MRSLSPVPVEPCPASPAYAPPRGGSGDPPPEGLRSGGIRSPCKRPPPRQSPALKLQPLECSPVTAKARGRDAGGTGQPRDATACLWAARVALGMPMAWTSRTARSRRLGGERSAPNLRATRPPRGFEVFRPAPRALDAESRGPVHFAAQSIRNRLRRLILDEILAFRARGVLLKKCDSSDKEG